MLDDDLTIVYQNQATKRYTRNNGGDPDDAIMSVGTSLWDVIPEQLREFYEGLFARARGFNLPVSHDYDCSRPDRYHIYRMEVHPLPGGYLVTHALRLDREHHTANLDPIEATYRNEAGLVMQCVHCRRTRRKTRDQWDWVPTYVGRARPGRISNGICPPCAQYHYPPDPATDGEPSRSADV